MALRGMSARRFLPLLLLGLAFAGMGYPAETVLAAACTPPQGSSVPPERLASLARGFNLTGWVDSDQPERPDFAVLAKLRAQGFTYVRLPVAPERLMQEFSAPETLPASFAELDGAISRLLGLGFSVTLDLHAGSKLGALETSDPERAFVLIGALWQQLAQRYAGKAPNRLFFEVLNEPRFAREQWADKGPRLADTIRRAAPNNTIIYALSGNQRTDELDAQPPLADGNVVYAVHFYDPMVFTHQGLNWRDDPLTYLKGVPFPTRASDQRVQGLIETLRSQGHAASASALQDATDRPWDEARVAGEIGHAARWAAEHRVPIVINEFGVLAWKAPKADRVHWLQVVGSEAEKNCMGWAIWEYDQGFGFVQHIGNREIPDEPLIAALLGKQAPTKAGEASPSRRGGAG